MKLKLFSLILLLHWLCLDAAVRYVYIPRSWMEINELLNETEKQSGVKIENLITDTKKKMVLYDSLTGLDDVIDAAVEYCEYVLRVDVEVIREPNKVTIRKPFLREVREREPKIVSDWPEPANFSKNQHLDLIEAVPSYSKKARRSVSTGDSPLGTKPQRFSMTPEGSDIPRDHLGWDEARIDSLFKPRRVIDPILSSTIDEIVHLDKDDGIMDLETLPDTPEAKRDLFNFDTPSNEFSLKAESVYEEEILPSHPRDTNRKPKWILSLSPEKWKLKLERSEHPVEKVTPVSRRVEKRRKLSSEYFENQREAYLRRRANEDEEAPRRQR